MPDTPGPARRKRTKVQLDVNLNAELTGFCSAAAPTGAHHRLVKSYASPLFFGPPRSEALIELVTHLYTEHEAEVAQHLLPWRPRTAEKIAKLTAMSLGEVRRTLEHLTATKQIVVRFGDPARYTILPVIPGTFEMTLMRLDQASFNTWHRDFAHKFKRVWSSGYITRYMPLLPAPIRFIPVARAAPTLHIAWPADRLEEILDRYSLFAIGDCQCRIATRLTGEGCDRPTHNCVGIGPIAQLVLDRGLMRRADRQEVLEAKKNAEAHGCVTWLANEFGDPHGTVSCSCCGCCCHALRAINQFSAPGFISRPHFMPRRDAARCTVCGRCSAICPVGAWKKIGAQIYFETVRCVGCGLCVTACKTNALALQPVSAAPVPERSWLSLVGKSAPSFLTNVFKVWLGRMLATAPKAPHTDAAR